MTFTISTFHEFLPPHCSYKFHEIPIGFKPCWVINVSPHEMGRHIVFSSVVCPSHFRVRSISFEPLVGFTYNFAQMSSRLWWDDVQCLCLTKDGSRSRSQSKIKHCMTVFRVCSISFEPLVGFTNNFAQMSSMMRRCAVPMFDQGRVKVKVKIKYKTLYDCISCRLYIF